MSEMNTGLLAEIAFGTEANAMLTEPVMACLAGFVGGVRAIVADAVGDDRRTSELLTSANVQELEPVALAMAWRIDRLCAELEERPGAADGFAVGRAYAGTRMAVADTGMRTFLRRTAVRAFDVDIYPRGETLRLFALLSHLRRTDVEALANPGAADPRVRERLATHHLTDGDGLSAIGGLLLGVTTQTPEAVPASWVPPWERAVQLSTELASGD